MSFLAPVQEVVRAINVLYNETSSPKQRHQADRFLIELSQSGDAWMLAKDLLARSSDPRVQFYGANILFVKAKVWSRLSPVDQTSFRRLLLEVLFSTQAPLPEGSDRIADSIALIALRCAGGVHALLLEIFPLASNCPEAVSKILCVLPALVDRDSSLSRTQAEEAKTQMQTHASRVLACLNSLFSPARANQILDGLCEWQEVLRLSLARLHSENTLMLCLNLIGPLPALLPRVVSLLVGALQAQESGEATEQSREAIAVVRGALIALSPVFQAHSRPQGNSDICRAIGQLCCEFCEKEVKYLVEGSVDALKLRDLLFACAAHSDLGLVEDTLEVFSLVSDIFDPQERSEALRLPFFNTLLQLLIQAARYPANFNGWDRTYPEFYFDSDEDGFERFRKNLADSLITCFSVLQVSYLETVSRSLLSQQSWNVSESLLFAIKAVAGEIREAGEKKEFDNALRCVLSFCTQPHQHPLLLSASCSFIGSYGFWLCQRAELPESAVKLLLSLVPRTEAAAPAFLRLSKELRKHPSIMPPLVECTIQFLATKEGSAVSRQALVEGVASLLLALFAAEKHFEGAVKQAFNTLVNMIGLSLEAANMEEVENLGMLRAQEQIKLLTALFLEPVSPAIHPGQEGLCSVLVLVDVCLRKWAKLRGADLYEKLIVCLGVHARPLLERMVVGAVQSFLVFPSESVLVFMMRAVQTFGDQNSSSSFQQALVLLNQSLPKEDPEVLEAFFTLCLETHKRCPDALQPVLEPTLARVAECVINFSGRGPLRAGCMLLESLLSSLKAPSAHPHTRHLLNAKAPDFVRVLLHGVAADHVPRDLLSKLANLLSAFLRLQESSLSWFHAALAVSFPSTVLSPEDKNFVMQKVLPNLRDRPEAKFRAFIVDFAAVCRAENQVDCLLAYGFKE